MTPAPLRARTAKARLSSAIIVPCTAKHVPLLGKLLQAIDRQTRPPNEVIIAISGSPRGPVIGRHRYRVHVLPLAAEAYAGANRNRAAAIAGSDILVYQDADDLPHPQRLQLLHELFERYDVAHAMHTYVKTTDHLSELAWRTKRFDVTSIPQVARYVPYAYTHQYHNGNCATLRDVFAQFRWSETLARGQDVAYNKLVAQRFGERMVRLDLPLLAYRQHLSSLAHSPTPTPTTPTSSTPGSDRR